MELLYAKRFSKDLDSIQKEPTRKALLKAIKAMKEADSISQIKAVKKIQGYQERRVSETMTQVKDLLHYRG